MPGLLKQKDWIMYLLDKLCTTLIHEMLVFMNHILLFPQGCNALVEGMSFFKVSDGELVLGSWEDGALHVLVNPVTTLLATHGQVTQGAEKITKNLAIVDYEDMYWWRMLVSGMIVHPQFVILHCSSNLTTFHNAPTFLLPEMFFSHSLFVHNHRLCPLSIFPSSYSFAPP